jgi:TolA-binding protein
VPYYIVQIYYAQQNYEEVAARADELLKNNPDNGNNAEIHRILGEMAFAKEDYQTAAEHLKLYELSFTDKKILPLREDLYLLGVAEYKLEDYAEAVTTLKKVKQENDSISESTCLHLGHAYTKTNDFEKAKLAYSAAMNFRISPAVREEAMYNYALCTYQNNTALGESIKAFNDFLQEYPDTKHAEDAYRLLATVYMDSKNYRAALEAVNAIPTQTQKLREIKQYLRYQIGVDAFLQGKMQETVELMTEVIDNEPNTSVYKTDAYYYRAEAEYRLHQYELCYNDLRAFLAQPDNRSGNRNMACYLMGYALFSLKQYSEAEVEFRRFVETADRQQPVYADALNRIGDCCFNNRAFSEAAAAYGKVVELKTAGADYAMFQLGYVQGLQRRYADKVKTMESLVEAYPKSDYADDALYEIARANLQDEDNEKAINAYQRLITDYPNSNFARKSSLEMAMTYRNMRRTDEAVDAFKQTISLYPGTDEAYTALEALEQIFVETNRVTEYLAYTRQLGKTNMKVSNQEDSLTYVTAELQYMLGNYKEAAAGLATYMGRFCSGGRYCTMAAWYSADCHYRMGNNNEAIETYKTLLETPGNPYMEETCTRLAELQYDKKDYAGARESFYRMRTLATQQKNRTAADLGVLRCSYFLNDDTATVSVATRLIESSETADNVRDEALYNRGKAYYRAGQFGQAAVDFSPLSKNVRVVTGAEAAYLLADCYFRLGALDSSESEIMRFAGQKTQHQYWLAKSLILLSDINVRRNELFQARQYLLSLQSNYKADDDIQAVITDKLAQIDKLENPETEQNEQEEEAEL